MVNGSCRHLSNSPAFWVPKHLLAKEFKVLQLGNDSRFVQSWKKIYETKLIDHKDQKGDVASVGACSGMVEVWPWTSCKGCQLETVKKYHRTPMESEGLGTIVWMLPSPLLNSNPYSSLQPKAQPFPLPYLCDATLIYSISICLTLSFS